MLYVKRLTATARLPQRDQPQAAAISIYADQLTHIAPRSCRWCETGLSLELDPGKAGWLISDETLADGGLEVSGQMIDAEDRRPVRVLLQNQAALPKTVKPGEKIANLLIIPVFPDIVRDISVEYC